MSGFGFLQCLLGQLPNLMMARRDFRNLHRLGIEQQSTRFSWARVKEGALGTEKQFLCL